MIKMTKQLEELLKTLNNEITLGNTLHIRIYGQELEDTVEIPKDKQILSLRNIKTKEKYSDDIVIVCDGIKEYTQEDNQTSVMTPREFKNKIAKQLDIDVT